MEKAKGVVFPFRTVVVRGNVYLRVEDVAAYLVECGSGEETDVRNRLKEAAKAVLRSKR